jgi:hypothetical protein
MTIRNLGALLFVIALGASCAVDEADESSEVQSLGASCTLLRPLVWYGNGVNCIESASTPLQMVDGMSYTAYSTGSGIYGRGSATVVCNNGHIQQTASSCRPGIEN